MAIIRKKSVEVEGRQLSSHNINLILKWVQAYGTHAAKDDKRVEIHIRTLEGVMTAREGDWVIRGVSNEFYPCKREIVEKTYDYVRER